MSKGRRKDVEKERTQKFINADTRTVAGGGNWGRNQHLGGCVGGKTGSNHFLYVKKGSGGKEPGIKKNGTTTKGNPKSGTPQLSVFGDKTENIKNLEKETHQGSHLAGEVA